MKLLTKDDLESLSLGAAILGSGGGGSPSYNLLMAQAMIDSYGQVKLLTVDDLQKDDLVAPIAFMGAPLVALEKFASGHEYPAIFDEVSKHYGRMPTVLMPAEIGGANAFTPIWVGAMLGIPVLDADTIGRAFPELQMSSCTLHNISPSPAFLADSFGNTVKIQAKDVFTVERMARHLTIAMGSRAAVALYLMNGKEAKNKVVPGSISRAIRIGKAIRDARSQKLDPTHAVICAEKGMKLGSGYIADIDHQVAGGFLKGKAVIHLKDLKTIELHYQNEFLIAFQDNASLAATPDILILMEQETGEPITSSSLAFGMRVDLIGLDAPDIWKTNLGLKLVGPRYFGYDVDYKPLCKE